MDEHELEGEEGSQVGEGLQVVFGEVEFDEVDAEMEGVDLERVGGVEDEELETVGLRDKFLKPDDVFGILTHNIHETVINKQNI